MHRTTVTPGLSLAILMLGCAYAPAYAFVDEVTVSPNDAGCAASATIVGPAPHARRGAVDWPDLTYDATLTKFMLDFLSGQGARSALGALVVLPVTAVLDGGWAIAEWAVKAGRAIAAADRHEPATRLDAPEKAERPLCDDPTATAPGERE